MSIVYVAYPRSSSHIKLIQKICPADSKLIILPDRNYSSSSHGKEQIIGFRNRIINRKKIKAMISDTSLGNCTLLMPFFYELPGGGIPVLLFEEGLSAYQELFLTNSPIPLSTKLKDLLKIILVKIVMINYKKLAQKVVLGPNYAFGRKFNPEYSYFVTNPNALLPERIKPIVSKQILKFNKNNKSVSHNPSSILFVLDPLIKNSKLSFETFTTFLNTIYSNKTETILLQPHPSDICEINNLRSKFQKVLKFKFELIFIDNLDLIPPTYIMEGLNSSMLYYYQIIHAKKAHSYSEEYSKLDEAYKKEIVKRYGSQNISFIYE